jgi:hypothetical protein
MGKVTRRKAPSKRRILARLALGRITPMSHLIRHDLDSQETIDRFGLYLDFKREVVCRWSAALTQGD